MSHLFIILKKKMKAHYSYLKIIAHMIQTLNEREHVPRYSNHQLSATY